MKQSTTTTITSVVPNNEFLNAFTEISNVLKQHCGPFASNALVFRGGDIRGSAGDMVISPIDEFTKDGITISSKLRSNNFTTEMMLRLVNTIGSRIDRTVNDGTTTAMLLFTLLMKNWENNFPRESQIPKSLYAKGFMEYIDFLIDEFKDKVTFKCSKFPLNKHTRRKGDEDVESVDYDIRDVNRFIAYHAALISSKGNEPLAKCISDIIYHTPDEALVDTWVIQNHNQESMPGYEVVPVKYDWALENCMFGREDKSYLNTEHNTIGLYPDAYVIYSNVELMHGGNYTTFIQALLGNIPSLGYSEQQLNEIMSLRSFYGLDPNLSKRYLDKPTVIFTSKRGSPQIAKLIDAYEVDTGIPVIVVQHQLQSANHSLHKLHCNTINAMGLTIPIDSPLIKGKNFFELSVMKNVHVKIINGTFQLTFNKLDDNISHSNSSILRNIGDNYHPLFKKTEEQALSENVPKEVFLFYNQVLDEAKEFVTFIKNQQVTKYSEDDRRCVNNMYYSLIAKKQLALKIYGQVHDIFANKSIVQDAFGAAFSSVIDGFVVSGYVSLLKIAMHYTNCDEIMCREYTPIFPLMRKVFIDSLGELLETIYHIHSTNFTTLPVDDAETVFKKENLLISYLPKLIDLVPTGLDIVKFTHDFSIFHNDHHLIQPTKAFIHQLERYKDIGAKLISTCVLIEPNHISDVNMTEKDSE